MNLEELKEKGEAPPWLTEEGYTMLSKGYLLKDETPKDMYIRVSTSTAKYLNKPNLAKKFFQYIWNNWLCLSTPVAANTGTDRGLNISCFNQVVPDTLSDIFMAYHETAILSKIGGGTSAYWGRLRQRGAKVGDNGVSDGVIPWLKTMESTLQSVSQGGVRRGSGAQYLDIESNDIEEFIDIRRPVGDLSRRCLSSSFHHGVCISDEFMNRCKNGDEKSRRLWEKILTTRIETGEPYLFFSDTVNRHRPKHMIDRNLQVLSSNLCVSGDTLILTDKGWKEIKSLAGQYVNVWNGEQFSKSAVDKTSDKSKLLTVNFSNGSSLKCTENHIFFIQKGIHTLQKPCKELRVGDRIQKYILPIIDNDFSIKGFSHFNIKVKSIIDENTFEETYCFNEPIHHKGALNGILTGNCNEIMLPSDEKHTFVCCLSSLNLARYEEWKDTDAVRAAIWFLDGVVSEFIDRASGVFGLEKAVRFAEKSRALGLGVLGWHSLLQSKMIPFESFEAMQLNNEIFRLIDSESKEATKELAKEYGEPDWLEGYGIRNLTRLAVAPTYSNSIISGGLSQGIEPISANSYSQKSAKGTFIRKNEYLRKLLKYKGKDTLEIWDSITVNDGSVRNLDCLTDEEKSVFLTAREINQFAIVRQAAQRQKYIDQGQSLNLFFTSPKNMTEESRKSLGRYIHQVHWLAWELELKGLYYCRSSSVLSGDSIYREESDCKSCQG